MKKKRIKIMFERIPNNPPLYEVTQMSNAVLVEWPHLNVDNLLTLGTKVTEKQCDKIARCNSFDVTICNPI